MYLFSILAHVPAPPPPPLCLSLPLSISPGLECGGMPLDGDTTAPCPVSADWCVMACRHCDYWWACKPCDINVNMYRDIGMSMFFRSPSAIHTEQWLSSPRHFFSHSSSTEHTEIHFNLSWLWNLLSLTALLGDVNVKSGRTRIHKDCPETMFKPRFAYKVIWYCGHFSRWSIGEVIDE